MPDNNTTYTNPNLTRQIVDPSDIGGKKYDVFISGVNSYRYTETPSAHDEDSDNDEIP